MTKYEDGVEDGYAQCLKDLDTFLNGLQLTQELKDKLPEKLWAKCCADE